MANLNEILGALHAGTLDRARLDEAGKVAVEFAEWLAFPTELGRLPDTLEIIDTRTLPWPPRGGAKTKLWLVRWTARDSSGLDLDDAGVGLVGSVMFCLVGYACEQRPPEDIYAIHCYWELAQSGRATELGSEVEGDDVREILARLSGGHFSKEKLSEEDKRELLAQWTGPRPTTAEVKRVVTFDRSVSYPARKNSGLLGRWLGTPRVGIAKATLGGKGGWLALDGERSRWYPRDTMPEGSQEASVLALHCGRVLLGFTSEPDRKAFLLPAAKELTDEERVARFEAFLERHRSSSMDDEDPLDVLGPAGKHLEGYVAAALRLGRRAQVASALAVLDPRWQSNMGRAKLAEAAFRAEELALAERNIRDLIAQYPDAHRSKTMGTLALILERTGRRDEAWWLLTESLTKLVAEAKKATGSDVRLFATWRDERTRVLRDLFGARAEAYLATLDH